MEYLRASVCGMLCSHSQRAGALRKYAERGGARATAYPGRFSTDLRASEAPHLDIRREEDWRYYFAPSSIDKILCEHCLEHMSFEDGFKALSNFQKFLPAEFQRRTGTVDEMYCPRSFY
jgi:predicted SAM-dependent methyltransferase